MRSRLATDKLESTSSELTQSVANAHHRHSSTSPVVATLSMWRVAPRIVTIVRCSMVRRRKWSIRTSLTIDQGCSILMLIRLEMIIDECWICVLCWLLRCTLAKQHVTTYSTLSLTTKVNSSFYNVDTESSTKRSNAIQDVLQTPWPIKNTRWQQLRKRSSSKNSNDWTRWVALPNVDAEHSLSSHEILNSTSVKSASSVSNKLTLLPDCENILA